ncbi:MAG TPA: succinyldiaminopimelate transaminase [Gammaproteobacteria bacterium]|nr:succinyldiaminopimelate transaminase [Gammaproteobacteria bacterium]
MNPGLDKLHPYPFQKLTALKEGVEPCTEQPGISLAMGEPRHAPPAFIAEEIITHLHGLSQYPVTRGSQPLREAIANWLVQRFALPRDAIDPDRHVLPVNGTREALFAIAQCLIDPRDGALVMMPNPFYQIYEGAALLAGAEPRYLNTTAETGWLPDFDAVPDADWTRCRLLYICSPGNPTGRVMGRDTLAALLDLAERHDFIIAADECYSELYPEGAPPPPGLLEVAAAAGNDAFERCLVFHSLSKRSNVPGLRSGFVAGDARLIDAFFRYRTYHGCAMAPPAQAASLAAWKDEDHVRDNRALYQTKFDAVCEILCPVLDVHQPQGGFYLWPDVGMDDTLFARDLYAHKRITVLPGSFLSRTHQGINPGSGHVRIALVAALEECTRAAEEIRDFMEHHPALS